jgi:two-component system sensor histidine kinase and response regulator WspE
MVHAVGGSVRIQSRPGNGTTFHLQLPITLSVIRAVLVEIAGEPYAFPHNRIDRLIRLPRSALQSLEHRQYFDVDGRNVGVVLARQILHLDAEETTGDDLVVVLFSNQTQQYGLIVDGFRGEQDLVVRPLDSRLGKVPNVSAAAILEDGSPVLIVDLDDLRRSIEKLLQGGRLRRAEHAAQHARMTRTKRILVVDDSITVREVQRQLLANRGYEVETAVDGEDGWNVVRGGDFDLVISDVDMPRLNGLDFVRRIKADSRLQAIPVVIVSYKDREEDRLRGLDAGANYYLTKSSFHDETLVQAVQDLIGEPQT